MFVFCLAGATPVLIEINPQTLDMDLEDVKTKATIRTQAIIVIHYYGGVCGNLEEILKLARENNILVSEDCAHSLGAQYKGKKVGNFGGVCF